MLPLDDNRIPPSQYPNNIPPQSPQVPTWVTDSKQNNPPSVVAHTVTGHREQIKISHQLTACLLAAIIVEISLDNPGDTIAHIQTSMMQPYNACQSHELDDLSLSMPHVFWTSWDKIPFFLRFFLKFRSPLHKFQPPLIPCQRWDSTVNPEIKSLRKSTKHPSILSPLLR